MRAILRLFFGNEVDRENFPRLRVLLCILLSLACLMVIIGIMGYMMVDSHPKRSFDYEQFNQAVNAFLLDLKAGKIKEAYAHTSKEYQKEVNEDQFIGIMKRHPFPSGKGTSSWWPSNENNGKTRSYWFSEHLSSGSIEFTLEVIQVGNEYQINKFSLK